VIVGSLFFLVTTIFVSPPSRARISPELLVMLQYLRSAVLIMAFGLAIVAKVAVRRMRDNALAMIRQVEAAFLLILILGAFNSFCAEWLTHRRTLLEAIILTIAASVVPVWFVWMNTSKAKTIASRTLGSGTNG
jgi:hypothetical protein